MSVLSGTYCPPCCAHQLPCDCVGDSYWSFAYTLVLPFDITCDNSHPGFPPVTAPRGTYTIYDLALAPNSPIAPSNSPCSYSNINGADFVFPQDKARWLMYWEPTYPYAGGSVGWYLVLTVGSLQATYTGPIFIDGTTPQNFVLQSWSGTNCSVNPPTVITVTPVTPQYCCNWCPGTATGNPFSLTLHSYYSCVGQNCGGQSHLGVPTISPCPCMVNPSQPNGFPATLIWNNVVGSGGAYVSSGPQGWVNSGCDGFNFRFTLRCTLVQLCITQGTTIQCHFQYGPQLHVEVQNCFETGNGGVQYTDWYATGISSCAGPQFFYSCNPICIQFTTDLHSLPTPYTPGCCPSMVCNGCNQFGGCDQGGCDLYYNGTLTA